MLPPPRPPPADTPPQQRRGKSGSRNSLHFPFIRIPLARTFGQACRLTANANRHERKEATCACCREETPDSTFSSPRTLSPFTKGDAFRCLQATERKGSECSAVELKFDLQHQSIISK
jgi:hypothetical protein